MIQGKPETITADLEERRFSGRHVLGLGKNPMLPNALLKTKDRLAVARQCAEKFVAAKVHPTKFRIDEFRRDWSAFLTAANSIFTVLEQGTKDSAAGRRWMGNRKHQRNTDPLLRYLHHARNADEHGIAPITALQLGRIAFEGDDGEIASLEEFDGQKGTFRPGPLYSDTGMDMSQVRHMKVFPDLPKLTAVRDRSVEYLPPTEHEGLMIIDSTPAGVASLAIAYLEAMIADAEAL